MILLDLLRELFKITFNFFADWLTAWVLGNIFPQDPQ